MTNVNAPFGLKPLWGAQGAPANHEMDIASIAYDDSTKIFRGDPVKQHATSGRITQWTNATAVSQLRGIFWGCEYLSTAQGKKVFSQIWPGADVASTAQDSITAFIVPLMFGAVPPTFLVQSGPAGIAFADIGANVDIVVGTGNTVTGQSGAYLDTVGTAVTLPFRIRALAGGSLGAGGYGIIQPSTTNPYGGSPTGAYNWVIVTANLYGQLGLN